MSGMKEMWVIGLALFSMFFGAGNVIFPPYLGYTSGSQWPLSFFCYYMADIGLAIVAIFAMLTSGSDIDGITRRIGLWPGRIMTVLIILCIGPLIAVPRTAATTYELSVLPLVGEFSSSLFSFLFFCFVCGLSIKESSVLDIVGKVLTPGLFLSLLVISTLGFITPLGEVIFVHNTAKVVSEGIMAGYQTLDVLAALIFGVIILKTVEDKGFQDIKDKNKIIGGASIVAGVGLMLVYCGLTHLGATTATLFPADITRVKLVTECVHLLFGRMGIVVLSFMVALACLTTAIGIVSSAGSYFAKMTNHRISYPRAVVLICVFSGFVATLGVEAIVEYAALLLSLLYAPILTLIGLTLFGQRIKNDNVFKGSALTAFLVSALVLARKQGVTGLEFIEILPFHHFDLGWVGPTLLGALLGYFYNSSDGDEE
jgi:LIVCS family branched-chain amino acid:cation transporter